MTEEEYEKVAFPALRALLDAVDELDDESVDAELQADLLTLEFEDGTRYVINSHRAARQIWMAAERSAWHFDWDLGRQVWVQARTGDELYVTLELALSRKLGRAVTLSRP